jgi:hypothetical protein
MQRIIFYTNNCISALRTGLLARFLRGGGYFSENLENIPQNRHTTGQSPFFNSHKNQFIFEGGEKIFLRNRRTESMTFCPKKLFLDCARQNTIQGEKVKMSRHIGETNPIFILTI